MYNLPNRNRSHSLAADRLLQGFNRGQGCTKRRILNGLCFETRKRLLAVRGGVNDYSKPINSLELIDIIEEEIKNKQLVLCI
ncbi:MAG: hypothetical protein U9Q89_04135 [Thermodesulfobacteriota bacterium]|nr:hypothetical protein [Thermodesulfobacteriota bacterium]